MIVDHTNKFYAEKRRKQKRGNKYNGAYYYSKDIVNNIIPLVETDRNWITLRLPEAGEAHNHSLVFIHNNRNPNYYRYLKEYTDVVAICSQPKTAEMLRFFTDRVIYLPLSVDIKQVERYRKAVKDKTIAFAGREDKLTNRVPSYADQLTNLSRSKLLSEMARYYKIYAVGRTAIEAKILGCSIEAYDPYYPNTDIWEILDNRDAAKLLQEKLDALN